MKRFVIVLLGFVLIWCAHPKEERDVPQKKAPVSVASTSQPELEQPEKMPAWVEFGSGPFYSRSFGKAFFGVARVSLADKSKERTEAERLAKIEIAHVLKYIFMHILEGFTKKYGSPTAREFEAPITQYAASVAQTATLEGVWRDPEDSSFYAMCVLTMKELKRQFALQRQIEKHWRDYIVGNIDVEFKRVAK